MNAADPAWPHASAWSADYRGAVDDPAASSSDGRSSPRYRNRQRIIDAARALFAERGYRGTATRDIAEASGLAERTLFRHFPSKAALFRESVIAPVQQFIQEFATEWGERPRGSRDTETEVAEFYANLVAVLDRERRLLIALVAALAFEDPDGVVFPELQFTLRPLFEELEAIFALEADQRAWHIDASTAIRVIIGMALGVTIHSDWLFGTSRLPQDALVPVLTTLTVWGLQGKPELPSSV
ncbi:TetR family transcriptional regulator [Nocardia sp. ET3-3]|uniref:TetR family transcriptional regulator n=1 Tax=Nocardia terrae TaxID=2675851 RepID=A0A7K1V2I0_9NOCA|nr:TetR/AcrR family transcriptional regulator [Nocardia terrae]MVU80814.1 TetR family transcriptional regulator [Nocardia terrae]